MLKFDSLTPDQLAVLKGSMKNRDVARVLGCGVGTVSDWRQGLGHANVKKKYRALPQSTPAPQMAPVTPTETFSGDLGRIACRTAEAPPPPPKTPLIELVDAPEVVDPIEQGKDMFEQFKAASNAYLLKRATGQHDLVTYRVTTDAPVMLCHMSDLHLGARGTDHDLAETHAKLIAETPGAYAIFGGDGIDNFIKHQSAMVESTSNPAQEYAALEYWLSLCPFLGGVSGNHDAWTKGFAGIDYLRQLFRRLNVPYTPNRLRVRLIVNEIEYRIELRHTFRFKSSINLSNQLQRMWEFSDWNWDIGAVGHTHDGPFIFPFDRHSQRRWGSLAGCYKVADGHSEAWGYNSAVPQSPCFILDDKKKSVVAFDSVEKGVQFLNAVRSYNSPA